MGRIRLIKIIAESFNVTRCKSQVLNGTRMAYVINFCWENILRVAK